MTNRRCLDVEFVANRWEVILPCTGDDLPMHIKGRAEWVPFFEPNKSCYAARDPETNEEYLVEFINDEWHFIVWGSTGWRTQASQRLNQKQKERLGLGVMTVHLGPSFSFTYSPPPFPSYCTTDTLPSLLVIALSWTYPLIPRLGQDALWTVCPFPYLLHALPSPLLYYLHVHQYLLMCTLCAPPMPAPSHCCLMYHCTVCARYWTP